MAPPELIPPPLTFRTLYESPLVRVSDYICRSGQCGPGEDEHHESNTIVLMRHGVFCRHFGSRSVTSDVNQAAFFSKGSVVRVSHPGECGDRGTVFKVAPRVLTDIVRELDPSVEGRPDRPFPFVTGPCDSKTFLRHRDLIQRLEGADQEPLEPLWADVTALQLSADILERAFVQAGATPRPRRPATDAEHADRVEAAKTYLVGAIGEKITLDDVARAVHTSPFHFTRIFQRRVGVPVHKYLTQLRLRASLERLNEGADDLTALAMELGFSSHSHFTDAFRKEFGKTPSQVREAARRGTGPE